MIKISTVQVKQCLLLRDVISLPGRGTVRAVPRRNNPMVRISRHRAFVFCPYGKSLVADFLTGKQAKNHGQLAQYLINDAHEGIVTREVFEAVQRERGRRGKAEEKRYENRSTGSLL